MNESAARSRAGNELQDVLGDVHRRTASDQSGQLADYIPELSRANPEAFGLAIATVWGDLFTAGDAQVPFTIQSVSKAFTYCLAIELVGTDAVLQRVGVEPSGDAFNAIQFDPTTHRPFNPMVNAGAITVAGVIHEVLGERAFDFIMERLSVAAGRRLDVDESVYESEAATGHRNRAIAHLLLAAGVLTAPVEPIVDLYFRQCSIRVTATDLAWMGASLANLGRHPVSREEAVDLRHVRLLGLLGAQGRHSREERRRRRHRRRREPPARPRVLFAAARSQGQLGPRCRSLFGAVGRAGIARVRLDKFWLFARQALCSRVNLRA
jgi:glutaminase